MSVPFHFLVNFLDVRIQYLVILFQEMGYIFKRCGLDESYNVADKLLVTTQQVPAPLAE